MCLPVSQFGLLAERGCALWDANDGVDVQVTSMKTVTVPLDFMPLVILTVTVACHDAERAHVAGQWGQPDRLSHASTLVCGEPAI